MAWQQDQQWLWQQILAGASVAGSATDMIHAGHLPVEARLAIYAGGYRLRLLECMRAAFPLLQSALGDALFDRFALGYLDAHPSQSYTLHHLGAGFADHLEQTRPTNPEDDGDWVDFMIALARFERALSEVYDGRGDEHETPTELQLASSLRLLSLSHPVHESLRAHQHQEPVSVCSAKPVFLAIIRRSFRVSVEPITATEFALLQRAATDSLDHVLREVRGGVGEAGLERWLLRMRERGIIVGEDGRS